MKTPISYYGGKQSMLNEILPLIPVHAIYTEVFFGGGAVFWAKEPAKTEIINDHNGEVINFYHVLKHDFRKLKKLVEATLHSRSTYQAAMAMYRLPSHFSQLHRAWAFWVLTNQGFAAQVGSWGFGKIGAKAKAMTRKKQRFTKELESRLETVQIEAKDAIGVLESFDDIEAFHYVDPPYVNACQGHYAGYTEEDFQRLLEALSRIKGKFLLSCYPSELLEKYTSKYGWKSKRIEKPITANLRKGTLRKRKVEMLVRNY